LWCPLLTHYRDDGNIDFDRMSVHLGQVTPWVRGYLIPGSTGDGWELDEEETLAVTEFAVRQAQAQGLSLLVGLLRTETSVVKKTLESMLLLLERMTGTADARQRLDEARVCAFAVCPPKGATLTQQEIHTSLSELMETGLPMALYQLPQLTDNEVAPETFEGLAVKHANLIFFKDSSGHDRIAASSVDTGGVFMVRGAEGEYARWLKFAGGPYDGFLLSTANYFPAELHKLIKAVETGNMGLAHEISARLTAVVRQVFELVKPLPHGNHFTNAAKAIDHYRAFGALGRTKEGPMLHAGVRLPQQVITETGAVLDRFELMPHEGYLK
jgi:4-hydroxy-tetrahydrodipicolinate synthase